MTESAAGTLPPDIKTDKLVVIAGAVLLPVTEPIYTTGPLRAWFTVYPRTAPAVACYPKERHVPVMHDVQVGTVDELVELYRSQLTRAYHAFAVTPKPGEEQPVIPYFGEPSLAKQNKAVAAMCDAKGLAVSLPANAGHKPFEDFVAPRHEKYGEPKPRQSAFEQDRLKRLVATYHNYRYPDADSDNTSPTDDPAKVTALIDALTVLREDADARHRVNLAKAAAEEPPEAPAPGTDVAKD
jgi:hypothetical protein